MEIRNIAIIAHVDHGKTTLTDAIMRQTGMFEAGESMDSNALEKERGITIYSKNTATFYKHSRSQEPHMQGAGDAARKTYVGGTATETQGPRNAADGATVDGYTKINIVDTPGHADFGSEVERVLRSIDNVLLIVDAQEGPMPQTRFVLKKALELGMKPIVVLNKIDKPAANPDRAHEDVFELFMDLGATDEQLDFTTVYAIGREGVAMRKLDDERKDLTPLLDAVLEKIPATGGDPAATLRAQPFNLAYDNFLGRLAVVRVYDGMIKAGDTVYVKHEGKETYSGKVTKLFTFKGVKREEATAIEAGDIGIVAGIPNIYIGDTITTDKDAAVLPAIHVDEPTIELNFLVNNSPFAGREGKLVTSRQIRERLERELEVNVGLHVDFASSSGDTFKVRGRGELHIAILLENMRREGYEVQVSQPQVIVKDIDGIKSEPFEEVTVDVPSEFQGAVIEKLGKRAAIMTNMVQHHNTVRMLFEGPTRGLLGYRGQFIVDTKGLGIMASRVIGFRPHAGAIEKRAEGAMTSMATGKALGYSLANLQTRGELYIGPNVEVYEGMVIGNTSKGDEMPVNPTKGKQLTNMRASGSDEALNLVPPKPIGIENGLEIMAEDEYLEITPKSVRLRKQHLTEAERAKAGRKKDSSS